MSENHMVKEMKLSLSLREMLIHKLIGEAISKAFHEREQIIIWLSTSGIFPIPKEKAEEIVDAYIKKLSVAFNAAPLIPVDDDYIRKIKKEQQAGTDGLGCVDVYGDVPEMVEDDESKISMR